MKQLYQSALMLAASASTLTAGLFVQRLLSGPRVWLSTTSPGGTYTVQMTGDKGRGGFLFRSTVRYNVTRGGRPVVEDAHAHSGDSMDVSFELAYPEHAWTAENVLRFWRAPHLPDQRRQYDAILLSNATDQAIKYLHVGAGDMFLVFDVPPRSALRLTPTSQYRGGGVGVAGELADGRPVRYGAAFVEREAVDGPALYCVTVGPGGVEIASPHMEGYDGAGDRERLNIPRAPGCRP